MPAAAPLTTVPPAAQLANLLVQAKEMSASQPSNLELRLAVIRAQNLLTHLARGTLASTLEATSAGTPKAKVIPLRPVEDAPKTTVLKVRDIKALLPPEPRKAKEPKAKPIKLANRWGAACREWANRPANVWNPKQPKSLPALLSTPEWSGSVLLRTEHLSEAGWGPLGWEVTYEPSNPGEEVHYATFSTKLDKGKAIHGPAASLLVDVYKHPSGAKLKIRVDAVWS